MRRLALMSTALAAAGSVVVTAGAAFAADLPVKAPRTAVVASSDGIYVWLDGSYQSVKLPTYSLGFKAVPFPSLTDPGPIDRFDPRATGYGFAGAIGYILPYGTFSPAFGSNVRIEVGGSYVRADATQSGGSGPAAFGPVPPGSAARIQLLNGTLVSSGFNCNGECSTTASLSTRYAAWQINAKVAGDFKLAALTLTPSVAIFGGETRDDQNFAQNLFNSRNPTFNSSYVASTSLHWTDWGARVGLDAKVDLTGWLTAGVGGYLGIADRSTSLSGNDAVPLGPPGNLNFFGPISSSFTTSASTTAFIANAEASLIARSTPTATIRTFVGLNYDDHVPGISAPSFGGNLNALTSTTPSGIKYSAETSWYAGGGVTVRFAP